MTKTTNNKQQRREETASQRATYHSSIGRFKKRVRDSENKLASQPINTKPVKKGEKQPKRRPKLEGTDGNVHRQGYKCGVCGKDVNPHRRTHKHGGDFKTPFGVKDD